MVVFWLIVCLGSRAPGRWKLALTKFGLFYEYNKEEEDQKVEKVNKEMIKKKKMESQISKEGNK